MPADTSLVMPTDAPATRPDDDFFFNDPATTETYTC
jgi:hypothetical protein